MMSRKKWLKVLTLFFYVVAVICFIVYLVKSAIVFMMAGAAFMCWGSVCMINGNKKDKD